MAFNEAPCKCCICTSLCRTGIPIVRYPDGSFSPPSITRRVPGTDRLEVVWLNIHLNMAWGDLTCAWNLIAGSIIERLWSTVPKAAGYAAALNTLGINPDALAELTVRDAVERIADTDHENLPDLWNNIVSMLFPTGQQDVDPPVLGVGGFAGEFDPSELATREDGTLITKSLKGCLGHVVTIRAYSLSRSISNVGRTDYDDDPFTIDTLIGCKADGSSPIAKLRVRMEHGAIIENPEGYWSTEGVAAHSFSRHSFRPGFNFPGPTNKAVELRLYAELIDESGQVVQSCLHPLGEYKTWDWISPEKIARTFQWRFSFVDGKLNAMLVSGSSVHIFDEVAPQRDPRQADCVGVQFVRGKGIEVSAQHFPMSRSVRERVIERPAGVPGHTQNITLHLSPATPSSLAPYCDPTHPQFHRDTPAGSFVPSRDSFPWRLNDNCEYWAKTARVLPGQEAMNFSELVLTIEAENELWPVGQFNLGATSDDGDQTPLIDNSFWLADSLGQEFEGEVIDKIEWSASIAWFTDDLNLLDGGNARRCGENWATLLIKGRCFKTIDPEKTQGPAEQVFFAFSTTAVGEKFFAGEEVDLVWSSGWTRQEYGFFSSGTQTTTVPTKFTAQLV